MGLLPQLCLPNSHCGLVLERWLLLSDAAYLLPVAAVFEWIPSVSDLYAFVLDADDGSHVCQVLPRRGR